MEKRYNEGFQVRKIGLLTGIASLFVFLGILIGMAWHLEAAGVQTIPVEGTEVYSAVEKTLQMVNEYRAENNKEPLQLDSSLTEVAMVRAHELFVLSEHSRPNGKTVDSLLESAGLPSSAYIGETIGMSLYGYTAAEATAKQGVDMFKSSSAHAKILKTSTYTHIGIGIVKTKGYGTCYCYVLTSAAVSGKTTTSSSDRTDARDIEVTGKYASLSVLPSNGYSNLEYGDSGVFRVLSSQPNGQLAQRAVIPMARVSLISSDPSIIQVNNAGQYKVVGTGNVTITAMLPNGISGDVLFTVEPCDLHLANNIVYLDGKTTQRYVGWILKGWNFPYNYTGTPVKPTVTIYNDLNDIWLTEGKDFTVSYSKTTNEGKESVESTITVTGINGCSGTQTCWYTIKAPAITSLDVTCPETLELGTKGKIEVTVHPMDFESAYYIHNLSTEVIDIDEKGVITPKAAGTARIHVQASNSSVLVEKEIEVVWAKNQGSDMGGSGTTGSSSTETGSATTSGSSATTGKTMIWTYTSGTGWHWQEEEPKQVIKPTLIKMTKPTVTGASNVSNGIKVTWKDASAAKGYYVLRKTGKGKWTKIATVKSGTRSYVDKKAKNGIRYSYTVQSYSGKSKSSYDTTGKAAYRLTNIKISSVKYRKSCKALVKWKKNAKAMGYQIQYSTNKNFSGATTRTVTGAKKTSYTISGLSKNTKYYVRVRAYYNKGGMKSYTSWSGSKTVKVTK